MSWTDERVELLKKLWAEGLSCSQIAGELGGVTRNAVIGKVTRLKLNGRSVNSRAMESKKSLGQIRIAPKPKPVSPLASFPTAPLPKEDPTPAKLVSLLDLTESSCRWPYGDPVQGFCGCTKVIGLPYCIDHARRAFRFPEAQRPAIEVEKKERVDA